MIALHLFSTISITELIRFLLNQVGRRLFRHYNPLFDLNVHPVCNWHILAKRSVAIVASLL